MEIGPDWLPVRAFLRNSEPWAQWIFAPGHGFTEPFFTDSVVAARSRYPAAEFSREAPLPASETPQPAGLIFHMSRCGSTLISRSLAATGSLRALSEAAPLDDILQTGRPDWLRRMAAALAGPAARSVFKLDVWHIRSLPLFLNAFPGVPWIFVCRDPLEVIVSQMRRPGIPALAGAIDPARFGMTFEQVVGLSRQRWTARVLGGLLQAALTSRAQPNGMIVDYRELPAAILSKVVPHFRLTLTPDEELRVREATRIDAKNPTLAFTPDTEAKRREAEQLEPDPCLDALREWYGELLLG